MVLWQQVDVAPVGVDMSWVWLQTFRRVQRDYKAATGTANYTRCKRRERQKKAACMRRGRRRDLAPPNERWERVITAARRDSS